ncbi:MAG TPA: DUF883 C-terminal domain-containing protein [Candidatus Methylomirabilis sp.]|nr:DUF883 C-terminal domain-containing protein [Candidatus Methylomirabilis sp.]
MDTIRDFSQSHERQSQEESDQCGSDIFNRVTAAWESLNKGISSTVESIQRRMVDFRDHGFDQVKDDVVKYTRDQPTNALLIAAGLGALLGILSALRRR